MRRWSFSALQRAEIAEMPEAYRDLAKLRERFSALQRAEIAEMSYPPPLMTPD